MAKLTEVQRNGLEKQLEKEKASKKRYEDSLRECEERIEGIRAALAP